MCVCVCVGGYILCIIHSVMNDVYYWVEWWKRDMGVSFWVMIVVTVTKYVYTV